MEQGVIECLNRRYRNKLLAEIFAKMELENKVLMDALKGINTKDVILIVGKAFHEISSTLV